MVSIASIIGLFVAAASTEDWKHLSAIFYRRDLLKLGFDASQDMHMLRPVLPGFQGGFTGSGFIDLRQLVPSLIKFLPDILG